MKKIQYENLNIENRMIYLFSRFCAGFRSIPGNFIKTVLVALYWIIVFSLFLKILAPAPDILTRLLRPIICTVMFLFSLVLFAVCVTFSAIPWGANRIANSFLRVNITNAAGEPPLLTKRWKENGKTVIELFSQGIPLSEFEDHMEQIESALDQRITKIAEGHNKQHILLYLAPGTAKLPQKIYLPILDRYLPKIILGESLDGPVIVDLNKQPHFLVAGSTGSGKTTLIKCIIVQLLIDRYSPCDVFLIDLKGGLDYPPTWHGDLCTFSSTPEDALSILTYITRELEQRKILFSIAGEQQGKTCSSLDAYNLLRPDGILPRIAVVVDEIAELTDTTGMDKEYKDLSKAIVGHLSTIARLGRAFGINLFIGTQRPDANAIPGQIKNNLDVRVCGKADNTLSIIVLDNTDAATLIPKDSQGLFLNQDGILFRGYLLDDSTIGGST